MKIVFIGTPKFGAIILEGLVKNNLKPYLVITSTDKPVGRKQILTPSPVKVIAQKYNIPIAHQLKEIKKIKPDLIIVAAFSQILPKEILKIPKYGSLNVHPSLLPKYRGPSPIQATILNGDKKTGVTIILMDEKIDHGKIISNFQFLISNEKITYEDLSKKLAEIGANLLIETIPKWIKGEIEAKDQDDSKATYTKIIKREDGKIDWSMSAEEIERQIRAFYPWPGSFTFWKKKGKKLIIKILEAEEVVETLPKNKFAIKCGKGYLLIKKLQPEGKKPMKADDFLRGNKKFI